MQVRPGVCYPPSARLQTFTDDPVSDFPEELIGFREGHGMQHSIHLLLKEVVHAKGQLMHAKGQLHGKAMIFLELVDHHIVLMSVLELSDWEHPGFYKGLPSK